MLFQTKFKLLIIRIFFSFYHINIVHLKDIEVLHNTIQHPTTKEEIVMDYLANALGIISTKKDRNF